MPAFNDQPISNSFNYLRRVAMYYNCNQNFDEYKDKVEMMNQKGEYGYLACLCKVDTRCPCIEIVKDLDENGMCYCGIFRRVGSDG